MFILDLENIFPEIKIFLKAVLSNEFKYAYNRTGTEVVSRISARARGGQMGHIMSSAPSIFNYRLNTAKHITH